MNERMIVMKFGGSSLGSPGSIARVASIIRSQLHQRPVIVASAMADTTDQLLELLAASRRANSYSAWKLQEAIRTLHFSVSDELLRGEQRQLIDEFLRLTFRDLHVRMLELSEGERIFSPELEAWTTSLGEQLSSRLLAAVLQQHCAPTVHLDARRLIVTTTEFPAARPCCWETYARLRWSVPVAARSNIVVLGGFIGSSEDGRTTTLGRGGSDLTASLVGAAINAAEIQVWKDVDGMLTCDPRLFQGAHQVRALSYEEAAELAGGGANILHPDTMAPARRLRIPIVIRNTFSPSAEPTSIGLPAQLSAGIIKSIAVQSGVALLEMRTAPLAEDLAARPPLQAAEWPAANVLFASERLLYLAVSEQTPAPYQHRLPAGPCFEVRQHKGQALLTLVGESLDRNIVEEKIQRALSGVPVLIVPGQPLCGAVKIAVPQERLRRCLQLLHSEFFAQPDPRLFIARKIHSKPVPALDPAPLPAPEPRKRFTWSAELLQPN